MKNINDLSELKSYIEEELPDVVVVEGYNAVGKSRVLGYLNDNLSTGVIYYRPDYTNWPQELPREFRWTIFSSFLDLLNKMSVYGVDHKTILLDRGFFSGLVYNNDVSLLKYYKKILGSCKVLNILVTCKSEGDYEKFLQVRSSEKELNYHDYLVYTERYRIAMDAVEANCVEFVNSYQEDYAEIAESTCLGCAHCNDGTCLNPCSERYTERVGKSDSRCGEYSKKEVQDLSNVR